MNTKYINNDYFTSIHQVIEYVKNRGKSFVIRILEDHDVLDNQNKKFVRKIENGIEFPHKYMEVWDYIKKFIPSTITCLEIPFSCIEKDVDFLSYFPNLTTLTLNDDCYLNIEFIKTIKEKTQVKNINIKNIPTAIGAWKENGFTHLGYPYNFIDYYGLKVYPDTKEAVQEEIDFDEDNIAIQSYDLKVNAVKDFYDMVHPNLKKKVNLYSVDCCYNIKFKNDNEIEEIIIQGKTFDNVISIYNDLQSKGYTIESIVYQFKDENYYNFDVSKFEELSQKCNLKFRYVKDSNYNDTTYDDFVDLQMCINWYKKLILEYNLSPCEKLMFAYDIVKSLEYKEETQNMSDKISRDPSQIMKTGYIVCVGYSILIEEILKGLDSNLSITSFRIPGHQRNLVKIDDEKYNIHGVFSIDSTWDNAKNAADSGYNPLDLYSYFLVPKNQYNNIFDDELPAIFKHCNREKTSFLKLHKELKELFGTQNVTDEMISKYVNIERPSLDTFIQILINVRMAEGYTKEQAIAEATNIVKVNQEIVSDYSQDGIDFKFFENLKHIR